jgi:outer membrane protein assembly factor BamD (BamD/ComL family)
MFAHTRKLFWAVSLLSVALGGCRSAPPLPPGVDPHEYNKPVPDNWLFPRLMGRDPQPPNPAPTGVSQAAPGSQVVQASATEPVTDPAHTSIVPPAGSKDDPLTKKEDEESDFLESLYPTNIYKNVKKMTGYGPDEKIARAAFKEAEELYVQKKFEEAAPKYATAASRWPDSPLEEDALFKLGECYFFTDQVSKAYDTYNKLLKKYEFSRYLDTAGSRLFAIARYWDEYQVAEPHWPITPNLTDKKRPLFDTWGHSIKAYEQVRLNDPTGPLADDSVMATANTYFKNGRYEDAAYNYDIIRKEYPKSEHQVNAHVLGVQSKMNVYQGPDYDGLPLKEAEEISQQALTQFPDQLGPEKQRMIQTKNEIIAQEAQRDWQTAQYYDNKKYYGAARYYYREVIKAHPQTKFAEMAQARLEEIKDLPADPPNRFKFLTDLFQSEDRTPKLIQDSRAPAPIQ